VTWSHNTHYAQQVLDLLPPSGTAVLEVGPGDGYFAEMLAGRFKEVTAVEADLEQVQAARQRCAPLSNVTVLHGDFLTADLPTEHFDAVTALAVFHHMPPELAFSRASEVLRPGGRLVLLGVWTDRGRRDFLWNLRSVLANRRLQRRMGPDAAMTAPASLERTSWHESRAWCTRNLRGAHLTRHALWRYTLIWEKPSPA
jgi:protein-L-isoaspartate O-methyltransferase